MPSPLHQLASGAVMALFALAACAPAATPTLTPTAAPVSAAEAATPAPRSADFSGLPESTTGIGFPQIGFPNAPVSVLLYTAFEDPASVEMWANTAARLAERARAGEILITSMPQYSETTPNSRGAARAAICAGDQSAYYRYADALFRDLLTQGTAALNGANLVALTDRAGLDRSLWNTCMVGDHPDQVLDETRRAAGQTTLFTGTPLVLVEGLASLPDAESLDFTINRALQAFNVDLALALTPGATAEATGEVAVTVEPLLSGALQPPVILDLNEDWRVGYATMLIEDFDGPRGLPVAVFSGPVEGGTGTIVLLWGFPNVVSPDPGDQPLQTDLYLDGLRLLRQVVLEAGCNIGTDLRRDDIIGGMAAIGSTFAAVDCPELPDTRGWFAGLRQYGLNYMFYAYTDPIEAMDGPAADQLRTVLETVQFLPVPEPTATPAPGP